MIDLSKHPCPWCDNTNGNAAYDNYATCSECGRSVTGAELSNESAAAAWIELSEKVHGKQHDGPTVEVRIATKVDPMGEVVCLRMSQKHKTPRGTFIYWHGVFDPACNYGVITATLPIPVAQEVKGRVEE